MVIPALNKNGELDAGEYEATLDEIEAVYGSSSQQRKRLMQGLREAATKLENAGVKRIWVNGSFITGKQEPNDIDGCWKYQDGVDLDLLRDDFLHPNSRHIVMEKYGLDFLFHT